MTPVTTQQVNRQTALDSSATTAKKMKSCMGNNNSFLLLACYMQQPTFILASQKKEQPAHSRLLLSPKGHQPFIASFRGLPGLKLGVRDAGMRISSLVCGFRPVR